MYREDEKIRALEETKPTILESIEAAHIFSIEKQERGYLIFECCDFYFDRLMTQEQLERLIQELTELSKKPLAQIPNP